MAFNLEKQFTFALASALTATAKAAQTDVRRALHETFTVRTNWDAPSNAMGIKVLPATKQDLSAAVATRADWLNLHEEGGDKTPRGNYIAVPTRNVRRTKRDIIRRNQRPKGLRATKTVVLDLKTGGRMLFERRNARLVPLYRLIRSAHIKAESTVIAPTLATFEKRFDGLFYQSLAKALATAR